MNNKQKTKKELIHEIDLLKRQAANLQKTNEKITKALKKLKQNNKHASVKENSEITRWESEEQYRMVVENAGEGIFIAQDGMIKFCNRETVNISGYTEETLTSRPFLEFIHREDRDMVWEQHVKRLKGKENPPTYSSRIYTADGSIKWIEISGVAVEWKGRPAAINFLKDITDRKLAEMALLSEREKYENLVELSPFGMMLIEKDGTIIYINHKFSEIFGYSIQEIPDLRTWGKKAYPDGQYRRQIISAWREEFVLLREGKKQINTHTVVTANGEKKIIAFTAVGLKNDQILVASEDITEHRKLEAQLRQSEKMKAIGTLAGGIAHDVNNILMGIQGYVSLLLLSSDPNHSNYDKLKAIESQVQSGADLTRQILGYARGGRYEVKPIDMNDLIGRTAVLFGRTKKEISIHQKYSREIWAVDADPAQMEQVFLNLFVNAWEAMPEGGSLFIETENVVLDQEYMQRNDITCARCVKISVTDTGVGMEENTRKRIFEPFFTTKDMGRGAGLGLASVYGIISGHGGTINVYSEKGRGTTFTINLPASQNEAVLMETQIQEVLKGHETILLIDDEKTIADVTEKMLGELGYRVFTAIGGENGVGIYRAKHDQIDLVIIDMIMPGMSGGEAFDLVKAINPGAKVILSSGYSMNGDAAKIMSRGVRAFLQKPFRLEHLSQKIREILNN